MARRKRPSLVAEIARLLVEYPESDWKALAAQLRDRALLEDIATAIDDALAVSARSSRATKNKRRRPRLNVLAKVAQEDKAKAEILTELKARLTDKDQAVTLAYIRGLARSIGMKEELAAGRQQVVNQLLSYLATKTTDEIEAALQAAVSEQRPSGGQFDRWVDLILGGNRNKVEQRHPAADD